MADLTVHVQSSGSMVASMCNNVNVAFIKNSSENAGVTYLMAADRNLEVQRPLSETYHYS